MIKFMGLTRRVCYGRVVYESGSISGSYTTRYGSRPATGLGSGFGSGFGFTGLILRSTTHSYIGMEYVRCGLYLVQHLTPGSAPQNQTRQPETRTKITRT